MVFNLVIMGMWLLVGVVAAGVAVFVIISSVLRRTRVPARLPRTQNHRTTRPLS